MANLYAVHVDPKHWSEGREFKYDRFLSEDRSRFVKSEHFVAFGLGKRSCPGESMAILQVLLYTVSLIQRYNILPEPGLQFQPVMNGFLRTPPHGFKLVFEPRKNSWYFGRTLDTLGKFLIPLKNSLGTAFLINQIFPFHNLLTSLHDEFLIGIKVYCRHSSIIFYLLLSLSLSFGSRKMWYITESEPKIFSWKLSFESRFGFIHTQHFHSVHFFFSPLSSSSLSVPIPSR